jgi:hypothetical protein
MADRHEDDHRTALDGQRAEAGVGGWLDEQPDVRVAEQRALAHGEAGRPPFQPHVRLVAAQHVEQGTPAAHWKTVEYDPESLDHLCPGNEQGNSEPRHSARRRSIRRCCRSNTTGDAELTCAPSAS